MTKITVDEDCGNAPKKQFILDFNIAFAKGDTALILDCLSDDIIWDIVGYKTVTGKDEVAELLHNYYEVAKELIIFNILSHGDRCSANGQLVFDNNIVAFADVYTFSSHAGSAKITRLTSYAIDMPAGDNPTQQA